jgi:hypothetical protein
MSKPQLPDGAADSGAAEPVVWIPRTWFDQLPQKSDPELKADLKTFLLLRTGARHPGRHL